MYRIASITKTFTGTAIMQLRALGRLQLDDPVVSFLPELAAAARRPQAMENVTIRRLLSHESGLRSEPPGADWSIPRYEGDVKRTLTQVEEIGAVIPPNRQWKYSNLGYQLLGEVIARVSGTPYPDYIKKKILQPLGMSSTSFEPLPNRLATRVATGYAGRAFSDELEVAPAMPAIFAEGGLWSCVKDLSSWLCLQLAAYGDAAADKHATETQVLRTEDLKEMHKPRYIVDDEWTSAWGISWFAVRKDDVIWIRALWRAARAPDQRLLRPEERCWRHRPHQRGRRRPRRAGHGPGRQRPGGCARPSTGAHASAGDAGAVPPAAGRLPRGRHFRCPRVARWQADLRKPRPRAADAPRHRRRRQLRGGAWVQAVRRDGDLRAPARRPRCVRLPHRIHVAPPG